MWLMAQAFPLFDCISRTESMLVSTSGESFAFVLWDYVAFAFASRGHKLLLGLLERAVFVFHELAGIARRLCWQI